MLDLENLFVEWIIVFISKFSLVQSHLKIRIFVFLSPKNEPLISTEGASLFSGYLCCIAIFQQNRQNQILDLKGVSSIF